MPQNSKTFPAVVLEHYLLLHSNFGRVSSLAKHISSFLCVIILLHVFTHNATLRRIVFDPMDSSNHAVLKPTSHHNPYQTTNTDSYSFKNIRSTPFKNNTGKYTNSTHITFEALLYNDYGTVSLLDAESSIHTPTIPRHYSYRFYKEINPPPPKAC